MRGKSVRQTGIYSNSLPAEDPADVAARSRQRLGKQAAHYASVQRGKLETPPCLDDDLPLEELLEAWEWAVADGETGLLDQTLPAFYHALTCQGRFPEAQLALQAAAQQIASRQVALETAERLLLARLRYRQGEICYHTGDYLQGCSLVTQALDLLEGMDQPYDQAEALRLLGILEGTRGNYENQMQRLRQGLESAQRIGDPHLLYSFLSSLGIAAYQRNDLLLASWYIEHALQAAQTLGDAGKIAVSLNNLGNLAYENGDPDRARRLLEQCLATCPEGGMVTLRGAILDSLGNACTAQGQYADAVQYFHRALELLQGLDAAPLMIEVLAGVAECWDKAGRSDLALSLARAALTCPQAPADILRRLEKLHTRLAAAGQSESLTPPFPAGDLTGIVGEVWGLTAAQPRLQSTWLPVTPILGQPPES